MRHLYFHQLIFSLFLLFPPFLAGFELGGAQFITYKGTINGTFSQHVRYGEELNNTCVSEWLIDGLDNSFLQVGVTPSWDSNVFWYRVKRQGVRLQSDDSCGNQTLDTGGCTDDSVYKLDLATAEYPETLLGVEPYLFGVESIDTMAGGWGYNFTEPAASSSWGKSSSCKVDFQKPADLYGKEGCLNQTEILLRYGAPWLCSAHARMNRD